MNNEKGSSEYKNRVRQAATLIIPMMGAAMGAALVIHYSLSSLCQLSCQNLSFERTTARSHHKSKAETVAPTRIIPLGTEPISPKSHPGRQ